jgi:hypothetical protein
LIKVNASPDGRYGVTLPNGVSKLGGRRTIINFALEAAKEGLAVVAWIIPGKEELDRDYRAAFIHAEYERQLLILRSKD